MCSLYYQYFMLVCFCLDHVDACLVRATQYWEMVCSLKLDRTGLVVGMYVLLRFWSSLVQHVLYLSSHTTIHVIYC